MASDYIKNEIYANYTTEDLDVLSKRLNIKKDTVRKIANRMGLTRRATVSNKIIDGKKKCCKCGEWFPISYFTRDPNQPNNLDYRCKKCKYETKESCPEVSQEHKNKCPKNSQKHDMAFGVGKKHNPIIMVVDDYGNRVKGKKCKGCGKDKPLTAFHKLHKEDPDNTEKRKNICKMCLKNKYKGIL